MNPDFSFAKTYNKYVIPLLHSPGDLRNHHFLVEAFPVFIHSPAATGTFSSHVNSSGMPSTKTVLDQDGGLEQQNPTSKQNGHKPILKRGELMGSIGGEPTIIASREPQGSFFSEKNMHHPWRPVHRSPNIILGCPGYEVTGL